MTRLPGRGAIVVGLLVVVLVVLAIYGNANQTSGVEGPTLSMHVTAEGGGRALYLWLAELGYDVRPLQYRSFQVGDEVDALFVLAPTFDLSANESASVLDWVARGGTLFVVGEQRNHLLDDLDIEFRYRSSELGAAIPLQPLFIRPPLERVEVVTRAEIGVSGPDWVAVLGSGDPADDPVAVTSGYGRGRIHVLSSESAMTNAGIGLADNANYLHHVLADVPRSGVILFDEYHHGLTEHGTLSQRLVREPWGWAIIWAAAFTFGWLAFSGKRFGKALPPPPSWARRSSGEYVSTLAAALRRGKHEHWLREQYVAQVKRAFSRRFRVRVDQPVREFAADLSARRADAADLAAPLERLESPQPLDEGTTLELMRDIDAIARRMGAG